MTEFSIESKVCIEAQSLCQMVGTSESSIGGKIIVMAGGAFTRMVHIKQDKHGKGKSQEWNP